VDDDGDDYGGRPARNAALARASEHSAAGGLGDLSSLSVVVAVVVYRLGRVDGGPSRNPVGTGMQAGRLWGMPIGSTREFEQKETNLLRPEGYEGLEEAKERQET
jgi:hypothetical protein